MRIAHLMYGGLGGHGSVVFSLIGQAHREAGSERFGIVFYGIEPVRGEYLRLCGQFDVPYVDVWKGPGLDGRGQVRILRWLLKFRPAVIMAHSQAGLPAVMVYCLLRPSTRVLYVEHQPNHLKSRSQWLASGLAPWLFRRVVVLTEAYRQELAESLGFFSRAPRAMVVPNGIDLGCFRPGASQEVGSTVWLGMQARMNATKDHETLLAALALLPGNFRLRLAGDGENLPELVGLAERLGVSQRVEFLGMLDEPGLLEFLRGLRLYIHSTRAEAMSTAIMQAQACGLPLVVSDVPGVRHQIEHGVTGWLVPPADPGALAQAIVALSEDSALCHQLALAARDKAEQEYSQEWMLARYRQAYFS